MNTDSVWDRARAERNCLVWKLEARGGKKAAKIPQSWSGSNSAGWYNSGANDAAILTADEARRAAEISGPDYGIGYLPREGSAMVGIDLDDVLVDGKLSDDLAPDLRAAVEEAAARTRTNVTPSGAGLRVLVPRSEDTPAVRYDQGGDVIGLSASAKGFVTIGDNLWRKSPDEVNPAPALAAIVYAHVTRKTKTAAVSNVVRFPRAGSPQEIYNALGDRLETPSPPDQDASTIYMNLLRDVAKLTTEEKMAKHVVLNSAHVQRGLDASSGETRYGKASRTWSTEWPKAISDATPVRHGRVLVEGMTHVNGRPIATTGETGGWSLELHPQRGAAGRLLSFEPISIGVWNAAALSPPCIVEDYLYADIALLIAAGGVGKTTLMLQEAIHIALGLPLYGKRVLRPGPVVIITAEDGFELLVARLREVAKAMNLTPDQIDVVRQSIRIEYVGGEDFRLCRIQNDTVVLAPEVEAVVEAAQKVEPVMLVIDPAVSFGVGEQRVNDAEQGLIKACRRIRDSLGACCIRVIHHTGKGNAREKTRDQYSGRGGSAMADGARMVHVIQPLAAGEFEPETDEILRDGESGLVLAQPKMSFCKPQPDLFLRRRGFHYDFIPQTGGGGGVELAPQEQAEFLRQLDAAWEQDEPPGADVQATDWAGHLLGQVLGRDTGQGCKAADLAATQKKERKRCKRILVNLEENGIIRKVQVENKAKGRCRPCIQRVG